MTGGLGNQMFIYAFYMKMKRLFPNTRIDLSDMMHYHVHNGYELHRNVICNSTFSWWGAWLNPRRDKIVMAPARWSALAEMPYICPKDWTLVPVKFDATQAPQ